MIVTLTTSLPFGPKHALLEMQAEACTPTKSLNNLQSAIVNPQFAQQWGLDATGNWKTFKQDNDGNGTWELNQTRTTNKANEITAITNSVGAAWATPTHDTAGNMTGIPNPPSTTPSSLAANYDAWNRLVWVSDGATSVSQNFYDARGYRIRKDTYTSGTLTETRHYYYTPGWQCVEERVGTSTTLERQFVWGLRYIDDLIMRDRSTANNGVINERRYAMQDGNWNTIAICDITGFVGERYAYSAYGTPVFMTGAGGTESGTEFIAKRCKTIHNAEGAAAKRCESRIDANTEFHAICCRLLALLKDTCSTPVAPPKEFQAYSGGSLTSA